MQRRELLKRAYAAALLGLPLMVNRRRLPSAMGGTNEPSEWYSPTGQLNLSEGV